MTFISIIIISLLNDLLYEQGNKIPKPWIIFGSIRGTYVFPYMNAISKTAHVGVYTQVNTDR